MAYRLAWAQGTRTASTSVRRKEVLVASRKVILDLFFCGCGGSVWVAHVRRAKPGWTLAAAQETGGWVVARGLAHW
jgi:hypothetical protein